MAILFLSRSFIIHPSAFIVLLCGLVGRGAGLGRANEYLGHCSFLNVKIQDATPSAPVISSFVSP
jgi:hypothetical protein